MAPTLSALAALHWVSLAAVPANWLADVPPPTILYWTQMSPYAPAVFLFGLVTLFLVAVAAFSRMAKTLYVHAVRDGDARGGGAGTTVLLLGPLLGSPLAALLCGVTATTLLILQDLTSVPAGVFAAACALGAVVLLAVVIIRHVRLRQHQQPRLPLRLHVASIVGATLLTLGVVALFVLVAFSSLQSSYTHLTSAVYEGQRYHLAREDTLLEHSTLHLYRCDALGLLCQEVDSYGRNATVHGGLLQVDEYANTVTAQSEDGHLLFTYPLGDFFGQ